MDERKIEPQSMELPTASGEQEEETVDSKRVKMKMDLSQIQGIQKKYKKIQKYMKSSLFAIKVMDGDEKVVSKLLKEFEDNPL
jgi:hypothetical protein